MIILAAFLFLLIIDWIRLTLSLHEVLIWIIDIVILPYYIVLIFIDKHSFKTQFFGWVSFRSKSITGHAITFFINHV